jgi:hypothetical protein
MDIRWQKMTDKYVVTCRLCDRIDPKDCNRADCPMENYFWSQEEDIDE